MPSPSTVFVRVALATCIGSAALSWSGQLPNKAQPLLSTANAQDSTAKKTTKAATQKKASSPKSASPKATAGCTNQVDDYGVTIRRCP